MQPKFTLKQITFRFGYPLVMLILFCFLTGKISAQQYSNGNLSTGTLSSNGITAPAGFTWSEVQPGNINAGYNANANANAFTLADNFTIGCGTWTVTKFTFYAYSTGFAGPTSPFNLVRMQIFNTNPSVGSPAPIFGDLTTNRFLASSSAGMYRIFTATTATDRHVWKVEATIPSLVMNPGTYWVEWQVGGPAGNFCPAVTVVGTTTQPGNNALQRTLPNTWTTVVDGGGPQDFPFLIDYTAAACSGTPNPGATQSSAATACPTIPFTLSLANCVPGTGVTYNWEQSATLTGTYVPVPGATNTPTLTIGHSASTYYRARVVCGANTGISTPVLVNVTPPSGCYCAAGSPDVTFEKISRVQFNTIDNASTGQNSYQNFTAISTTVIQQQTIPITVTISNAFSSDQVKVWIDFNQNGSFSDPGEEVLTTAQGVGPLTGNITIPTTSLIGPTRMRIRMYDAAFNPGAGPCGNTSYGEVEDYTVNIQPCIQGVFTTQPANSTIQCSNTTSFTVAATGSALTFYWEYATPAAPNTWFNVPNSAPYSGINTTTLTLTNASQAFNGYKYRAVMQGACTAVDFSNSATLTVNPLVATVSPALATICTGSSQQLSITNITSSPQTTTFSSGPITVNFPDGILAGGNNTIAVAGIPVNSVITNVSVSLNITHAWVSDMEIVLRGPNGSTINLCDLVSGTNQAGANFVNTIISSSGTTPLSAGPIPGYGGIHRADLAGAVGSFGVPGGPTGFTPNTQSWTTFMSSASTGTGPSGNWTIAGYDAGAPDPGTMTSWSLTLTYVAPVFATGVWTANPAAPNTMFTNVGLTTPYVAGTPVTTIYVNPTVNTVYSVVVTTGTPCVSAPLLVPVNVTNPVSAIVNPTNRTVCVGSSGTFTVSAAGGPLAYQWQVSVNGGVSFTDIAGATGATLTLSNVTQLMHNNQYRARITASPCNTLTSGIATLSVNPLPTVTLSATDLNIVPGGTSTITVASNPAGASYSWTLDGATIAGATGSSVVANIDNLGEYKARVTDINGCVNTTAGLVIGAEASDRLWIYPNPSSGQFQVRLFYSSDLNEKRIVSIYNSAGALITKQELALDNVINPYVKMDFDLTKQGPGVYVVKVAHKYSGKITSGLVVIQQ